MIRNRAFPMSRRTTDFPPFTAAELAATFADPEMAHRFPPVLSVHQAAELLQIPVATVRDWSSRGLLRGCARKIGKHLRISRDRFYQQAFNNFNSERQG